MIAEQNLIDCRHMIVQCLDQFKSGARPPEDLSKAVAPRRSNIYCFFVLGNCYVGYFSSMSLHTVDASVARNFLGSIVGSVTSKQRAVVHGPQDSVCISGYEELYAAKRLNNRELIRLLRALLILFQVNADDLP